MSEIVASQRSRGMRDRLPDEMDRIRFVQDRFAATCRAWAYREIRTPAIEPLHLFTAAGTLSPHTLDRVYSFLDWDGWSGERVVLRPDSTIPAARLYAEHLDGGATAKLFYQQDVFRFTDDDSDREALQCGVELIGDTGPAGDIELALLACDVLRVLGIADVTVHASHAGIVRAVLAAAGMAPDEQAAAYDRLLDGDLAVVPEIEARLPGLDAPLHLLFDIDGAGTAYVTNLRGPLVAAIPSLAAPFDELEYVIGVLEATGIPIAVRAVLARSFEYYSGLVTRIDAGSRRVVAGGRYDDLIGLVGGRRVPASGFALYVGEAIEAMPGAALPARSATVTVSCDGYSSEGLAAMHAAAGRLRAGGLVVETVAPAAGVASTLVVGEASPRYRVAHEGRTLATDDLDEAAAALGAAP